ncbi:MAG: galactitol-1-phosphate 5-dehydrogenase [Oscillospiraceae bacterium]|nr:galactitol-1-phosphate 5-dehydrogenase [Oscillospiraceae bacterium]
MKAYVLHGIGDLRFEDVPVPEIKDNEVLVEVKAAGICGSDIPRIYKTGAYSHPLIPGHEFSGIVVDAGRNTTVREGKRVGVFPLIPCGECMPCKKKLYEMCRSYGYLGSRKDGGFAEYAAVPEKNLIELPDNVIYEEAAMLEPMSVAVHSVRRTAVRKENSVVVCGLGTIGLMVIMILRMMGIENIYAVGNKDFQKKRAERLGISGKFYCDAGRGGADEQLADKLGGNGADVFFECVGKNEVLNMAVNNTAPGGKIMLVGNPYSDMSLDKAVYWKILRNQLTITGTWNSSFTGEKSDDWHYVLEKLKEKSISPSELISHKFNMREFEKGFRLMRDKSEDYVKIMWSKGNTE